MDKQELEEFGKGVAVRAGVLAVGGLIVGGVLVNIALNAAGAAAKLATGLLVIGTVGGVAAWKITQLQKRFAGVHPATREIPA